MSSPQQAHFNRVASNLLYAGLAITYSLTWAARLSPRMPATGPALLFTLGPLVFKLVHYYFVRKGKTWAKALLAGLFVLGVLLFALNREQMLEGLNTPLKAVNYGLTQLVQAVAIFCVYRYGLVPQQR